MGHTVSRLKSPENGGGNIQKEKSWPRDKPLMSQLTLKRKETMELLKTQDVNALVETGCCEFDDEEDLAACYGSEFAMKGDELGWNHIGMLLGRLAELKVDFQYERVKAPGKVMFVSEGVDAPYVNIFSNASVRDIFKCVHDDRARSSPT
jgi:hypothetical protein